MSLTKTLRTIFRDYVTDGLPSSGANPPSKFDLRQWGDEIETALALNIVRVVTLAGAITVDPNDRFIEVNRTVPAAAAINLPAGATMTGPLTIVDAAGVWDSNTQTLTPNGAETIAGLSTLPLTGKYQSITLYWSISAGKWLIT